MVYSAGPYDERCFCDLYLVYGTRSSHDTDPKTHADTVWAFGCAGLRIAPCVAYGVRSFSGTSHCRCAARHWSVPEIRAAETRICAFAGIERWDDCRGGLMSWDEKTAHSSGDNFTEMDSERSLATERNASIAIVGMACRYPDARSPVELWENVLLQRRSFRRIPPERLRHEDYFSADRAILDHTYSFEAALIDGYEFDRFRYQ